MPCRYKVTNVLVNDTNKIVKMKDSSVKVGKYCRVVQLIMPDNSKYYLEFPLNFLLSNNLKDCKKPMLCMIKNNRINNIPETEYLYTSRQALLRWWNVIDKEVKTVLSNSQSGIDYDKLRKWFEVRHLFSPISHTNKGEYGFDKWIVNTFDKAVGKNSNQLGHYRFIVCQSWDLMQIFMGCRIDYNTYKMNTKQHVFKFTKFKNNTPYELFEIFCNQLVAVSMLPPNHLARKFNVSYLCFENELKKGKDVNGKEIIFS